VIGTGADRAGHDQEVHGFDMNILCFDPAYENRDYIHAIQEVKDLRYQRGICRDKTWIRYTTLHDALSNADYISLHVPLLREGRARLRPIT